HLKRIIMKKSVERKNGIHHLMVPLFALLGIVYLSSCVNSEQKSHTDWEQIDTVTTGTIEAKLTYAPEVPKPLEYTSPKIVKVAMETTEVEMQLTDKTSYTFWTFDGHVPGPFVRVRQGDLVDFTLKNSPNSKHSHSIDLHAVIGPGGGADATQT